MITRPIIVTALSLSLFAAACGDADHDTATFSTTDDLHLRRTIDVISASDAGSLLLIGVLTSGGNQAGCPSIASVGAVTTITGNCTKETGVRLDGTIVVTNVQAGFSESPSYDPSKPSTVVADGWTVHDVTQVMSIDGRVTMTPGESADTIVMDVDTVRDGIAAHTDASYACDATDLCTLAAGSWMDVDGVGEATLSGTFRFDDPATGAITAKGAETLVIDVAADVDHCKTFRIDGGASQQVCEEEESDRMVPVRGLPARDVSALVPLR